MRPILLLLLSCCATAAAADSWLCATHKSIGFKFDQTVSEWYSTEFGSEQERYQLRRPNQHDQIDQDVAWVLTREADPNGLMVQCRSDFNERGQLDCPGRYALVFNRNNDRFLLSSIRGYVDPEAREADSDTPFMNIGSCSLQQ